MNKNKRNFIDWHLIIGSLITLSIILLFSYSAVNFDFLDPIELAISDIEFADLRYAIFREEDSVPVDTNIVLINISRMKRGVIAEMVKKVGEQNPKVVGIDVIFENFQNTDEDSSLALSLSRIQNLVMVNKLTDFDVDNEYYKGLVKSHDSFTENAQQGFANIPENNAFRTIRHTHSLLPFKNAKKESFAAVVVKSIDKTAYEDLINRENNIEIINYHGNFNKFYYLDYEDLFNDKIDLSFLRDKIILMGYMGENFYEMDNSLQDKFFTPLNQNYVGRTYPDMFGIVIHANIVSMILSRGYIYEIPFLLKILIVFIILYLNAKLLKIVYNRFPDFYGISSKVLIVLESPMLLFLNLLILINFFIKIDLKFLFIGIIFLPDILESYFKKLSKRRKE